MSCSKNINDFFFDLKRKKRLCVVNARIGKMPCIYYTKSFFSFHIEKKITNRSWTQHMVIAQIFNFRSKFDNFI